jgi:hypothetical protein
MGIKGSERLQHRNVQAIRESRENDREPVIRG